MNRTLSAYPGWVQLVLVAALLLVLGGLVYANYQFTLLAPGGNDFLARWVGARYWLAEGTSPYAPEVSLAAQEMIYGRPANPARGEDVAHFVYPFPSMVFFAPMALLPFPAARAVWMTLLELGLPVVAVLGLRLARWRPSPRMLALILLFSIFWYHGLRAVVVGQFAVLEAVLLAAALLSIQRNWDIPAGIFLALSIAKPQMSFLIAPFVVFWAVSRRRWTLVLSAIGGVALLLAGSLALDPGWPLGWLRQLVDYPRYTSLGSPISIAASVLPRGSGLVANLVSGVLGLYLLWEWILALRQDDAWFQWTAALTLAVTNLIAFRTATTNFVVLLPVLMLMFSVWNARWGASGRVAIVVSILILTVGLWGLFLLTLEGNIESPAMYLPLPVLTLLGLWWIRWWAIRGPQVTLESGAA